MELFKNIFFNTDKIVENADVKVTYAGWLFQNGSQNVQIHLGFGDNWDNAQDILMERTDLGFQAIIHVDAAETLNFCFKNDNGEWDNNEGQNFVFKIEAAEVAEEAACDNIEEAVAEEKSLVAQNSSWAELIKKTFKNIMNAISKLFSGNKEKANDANNE